MLLGSKVIKAVMAKRGYRHRRAEDQLTIRGEYARNLQFVYSKEIPTSAGLVVDLIYFSVDICDEKLVIGLFRENPEIENGVYVDASQAISLKKFSAEEIDSALTRLIPPIKRAI
jgi:hypothetical protein